MTSASSARAFPYSAARCVAAACASGVGEATRLRYRGIAQRRPEVAEKLELRSTDFQMKKKGKQAPEGQIVMEDHEWYQLVPNRIELINGENFGYDRQKVM